MATLKKPVGRNKRNVFVDFLMRIPLFDLAIIGLMLTGVLSSVFDIPDSILALLLGICLATIAATNVMVSTGWWKRYAGRKVDECLWEMDIRQALRYEDPLFFKCGQ